MCFICCVYFYVLCVFFVYLWFDKVVYMVRFMIVETMSFGLVFKAVIVLVWDMFVCVIMSLIFFVLILVLLILFFLIFFKVGIVVFAVGVSVLKAFLSCVVCAVKFFVLVLLKMMYEFEFGEWKIFGELIMNIVCLFFLNVMCCMSSSCFKFNFCIVLRVFFSVLLILCLFVVFV